MESGGKQGDADAPPAAAPAGEEEHRGAPTGGDGGRAEVSSSSSSAAAAEEVDPSDEKTALAEPSGSPWDDFSAEYIEKYNKYQSDYLRRLQAKYFSKKTFSGDDIFDEEITIENEAIRCSRWPCARSYLNPVLSSQEPSSLPSAAETSSLSNRKNPRRS